MCRRAMQGPYHWGSWGTGEATALAWHRNSMFHVHEPTQRCPWHGAWHTSVPSARRARAGLVLQLQPGSALAGSCAGCARDRTDSAFPDGPRSCLAAKRGLTINFYWCSAVCTVCVPCPVLRSGPEEVPFDTPEAKQVTAPSQAGCCMPAHLGGRVAICCATSPVARSTWGGTARG